MTTVIILILCFGPLVLWAISGIWCLIVVKRRIAIKDRDSYFVAYLQERWLPFTWVDHLSERRNTADEAEAAVRARLTVKKSKPTIYKKVN